MKTSSFSYFLKHALYWSIAIALGITASLLFFKFGGQIYSSVDTGLSAASNAAAAAVVKATVPSLTLSSKANLVADADTFGSQLYYFTDANLSAASNAAVAATVKATAPRLTLSAKAYLVADADTGEIIFQKNIKARYPIASITKLVTAITAKEMIRDPVVIDSAVKKIWEIYGRNGYRKDAGEIDVFDLLYPLLLRSSNGVADILANETGRVDFLRQMNEKAFMIGMHSSLFDDPSGLSKGDISTARDLFKLAQYLLKNQRIILDITRQEREATLGKVWANNSKFLTESGYLGGKTGYTDAAKQTLLSVFSLPYQGEKRNIAIIILQSSNRFDDVQKIINYFKASKGKVTSLNNQQMSALEVSPIADPVTTLTFVGDIMLGRGVKKSVKKNFRGYYSLLFKNVGILKESDILFGNLEGPASDKGKDLKNKYSFRMDPEILPVLKDAGFDVLSVANDHTGDWGKEAFLDTLDRLNGLGITAVGGGLTNIEATEPKIIEKNGLKFGFLAFSDVGLANLVATSKKAGILLASDPKIKEVITGAAKKVDVLIVSFHFGEEYKPVTPRQRKLAHLAIEAGAKIVVGSHPHVIQETENYKGGLIMYSLGNFISDQYFSKDTMQGLVVDVKINREKNIESVDKKIVQFNKFFQPEKIVPFVTDTNTSN